MPTVLSLAVFLESVKQVFALPPENKDSPLGAQSTPPGGERKI